MATYDLLCVGIIIIASGCAGFFHRNRGMRHRIGLGLLIGLPLMGLLLLTMRYQSGG